MPRTTSRYFDAYCRNLQRIGMIELIDEHRRMAEMRTWRASIVGIRVTARAAVNHSDTPCIQFSI